MPRCFCCSQNKNACWRDSTDVINLLVVISTGPSATEVQRVKGFGRGGFFRVVGGILSSGRELKATKSKAP